MIEPGQPCVMISGNASACGDFAWMKWISCPSISVLPCVSAFSLASHARQSYSAAPVARELSKRGQLHALRPVGDELPGGPARVSDALPEVGDRLVRHIDPERTDFSFARHKSPPPWIGRRRTGRPVGSGPTFHAYGPSPRQKTGWYCLTIADRTDA